MFVILNAPHQLIDIQPVSLLYDLTTHLHNVPPSPHTHTEGAAKVLSKLVEVAKQEKQAKEATAQRLLKTPEVQVEESKEEEKPWRRSSTSRLRRQEKSVREGE